MQSLGSLPVECTRSVVGGTVRSGVGMRWKAAPACILPGRVLTGALLPKRHSWSLLTGGDASRVYFGRTSLQGKQA